MAGTGIAAATALARTAEGRYEGAIPPGWAVGAGANGGIIAAILARAAEHEVNDPGRPIRSLTAHFMRPPQAGPITVTASCERAGRTLSNVSLRLSQGGRDMALALVACAQPREAIGFDAVHAPDVPPADQVPVPAGSGEAAPEIVGNFVFRPLFGPDVPLGGGMDPDGTARSGGWIEQADGGPLDAPATCALLDAWWPAVFAATGGPTGAPTVDYTVHIRRRPPGPDAGPVLVRFTSRLVADGFVEEDGELWTSDGVLLAQSRQLAVLLGDPARMPVPDR